MTDVLQPDDYTAVSVADPSPQPNPPPVDTQLQEEDSALSDGSMLARRPDNWSPSKWQRFISVDPLRIRRGAYLCLRCGWDWSPRIGAPDPPHNCARCRSSYWDTPPVSARAAHPNQPSRQWAVTDSWRESRKRSRYLERLRFYMEQLGGPDSSEVQNWARSVLRLPQDSILVVARQAAPNAAVIVDRQEAPTVRPQTPPQFRNPVYTPPQIAEPIPTIPPPPPSWLRGEDK